MEEKKKPELKRLTANEPYEVRGKVIGGEKFLTCMPLCSADYTSLIADAKITIKFKPDLVEWRADYMEGLDSSTVGVALAALREVVGETPIIFTIRNEKNQGHFVGDEEVRLGIIEAATSSRIIDLVDIELDNDPKFNLEAMSFAAAYDVGIIISHHDFEKTASENEIYKKLALMADTGADVVKYAAMAHSIEDAMTLMQASRRAREAGIDLPMITISMGEAGKISRITGGLYGSDMTYIACTKESGPGQLSVQELKQLLDSAGNEE